jgi:hypothetical protein
MIKPIILLSGVALVALVSKVGLTSIYPRLFIAPLVIILLRPTTSSAQEPSEIVDYVIGVGVSQRQSKIAKKNNLPPLQPPNLAGGGCAKFSFTS